MISRIVRPGDTCVDIGANIGIMSSLMATRAGQRGSVCAFEPHPTTRRILQRNTENWARRPETAKVRVVPYAVSNSQHSASLIEPSDFARNSGVASLGDPSVNPSVSALPVECVSFDDFFSKDGVFRLVKIDVEGHEDSVLSGMNHALSSGRIDFLIFEEMRSLPSPASELVQSFGYRVYMIDRGFWAPQLRPVTHGLRPLVGEATNLLAFRQPGAERDLSRLGWTSLRLS